MLIRTRTRDLEVSLLIRLVSCVAWAHQGQQCRSVKILLDDNRGIVHKLDMMLAHHVGKSGFERLGVVLLGCNLNAHRHIPWDINVRGELERIIGGVRCTELGSLCRLAAARTG